MTKLYLYIKQKSILVSTRYMVLVKRDKDFSFKCTLLLLLEVHVKTLEMLNTIISYTRAAGYFSSYNRTSFVHTLNSLSLQKLRLCLRQFDIFKVLKPESIISLLIDLESSKTALRLLTEILIENPTLNMCYYIYVHVVNSYIRNLNVISIIIVIFF